MDKEPRKKALIIEDTDVVRNFLTTYFRRRNFEVLQAEDGLQGLEMFRDQSPDLIMLDLRMPKMDGLKVLEHISKESPDTPVLLVSGQGTLGDAIGAMQLGAWDFIQKPIHDLTVLDHAVNRTLERSEFLKQKRRYRERLEIEVRKRTYELEQQRHELEEAYNNIQTEMTVRKEAEVELSRINRDLTMLSRCIHTVVRAADEQALIKQICSLIVDEGGYQMAWVGLADSTDGGSVRPISWSGKNDGYLESVASGWTMDDTAPDPTGLAIQSGAPAVLENIEDEPADGSVCHEEMRKRNFSSSISLPLISDTTEIGILTIYAGEPDTFAGRNRSILALLADDLAYGIIALRTRTERSLAQAEIEQNVKELRKTLSATVRVVASTVEARDPYTAGHQRRVASLAQAIATRMGLSEHQVQGVSMAGLVHDLGKISVPAELLSKPSKLTEIEFSLIRTHAQVGYDLLKDFDFPWPIADIVLQHHERLNGSGYPSGLTGKQMLLEAKILSLADVVEAMSSHRPYRPARGIESALVHINEEKGALFDEKAVEACIALFRVEGFQFE